MSRTLDYPEVFTPSSPPHSSELFVGREGSIELLFRRLRAPGKHIAVIGGRGVGKTAFIEFAAQEMRRRGAAREGEKALSSSFSRLRLATRRLLRVVSARIRSGRPAEEALIVSLCCSAGWTFQDLTHAVLQKLGAEGNVLEKRSESTGGLAGDGSHVGVPIGLEASRKNTVIRRGAAATRFNPSAFFEVLRRMPSMLIVLDEYDLTRSKRFHEEVGELMKFLSDHSRECHTRLIVSGVADSIRELFKGHGSVRRHLNPLPLAPLTEPDLHRFLREAERLTGIGFEDAVRKTIVENSAGHPYYVHLVGLASIECMQEREPGGFVVRQADLEAGMRRACATVFDGVLADYGTAAYSLTGLARSVVCEAVRRALANRGPYRVSRSSLYSDFRATGTSREDVDKALAQAKPILRVDGPEVRFASALLPPFLKTLLRVPVSRPRKRVVRRRRKGKRGQLALPIGTEDAPD